MKPAWNRCDVCGKFIPYSDLDKGLALRKLKTFDTEFTAESFETLCRDHYQPKKMQVL